MALELKIEVTERAANCAGFTVADTTGVYNDPDNLTGYGAPNPERSAFTAVLLADRINSGGSTQLAATFNTESGEGNVPTSQDGYYDILLALAPQFSLFNAYAKNQVRVYEGVLYVSTVATSMQREWTPSEIDQVLLTAGIYDSDTLDGITVLDAIGGSGIDIQTALLGLGVPQETIDAMPVHIATAGLDLEPDSNWIKVTNIKDYPQLAVNTGAYFTRIPYLVYCHTDKCRLNRDTEFAASDCLNCGKDDTSMITYYKTERAYKGAVYNFG